MADNTSQDKPQTDLLGQKGIDSDTPDPKDTRDRTDNNSQNLRDSIRARGGTPRC